MRIRSTKSRIAELARWIKKNKDANRHDFIRKTGGTQHQYYYIRHNLGIAKKNPVLSQAMKAVAKTKKSLVAEKTAASNAAVAEAMRKENEEFLAGATPPVHQVVVEGTTPDFIWYEMDLMQRKLSDVSGRLNHVMKVAQARDADQKKMMRDLISENSTLRVENNGLRQQVAELTEMINGAPV